MRKKINKIMNILLAVMFILICNPTIISAQELDLEEMEFIQNSGVEEGQEILSLEEYNKKFGHEEYNHQEITPRSASLSAVKTKTKNIVTSINGMNVGTVTIKYQSYIESGRPKFAIDTVYISTPPSKYGVWLLTDSYVSYSTDKISVHYTYSSGMGGMTDYATVNFVPEA